MIVTNFKAASFKSLNRNYPGSFQKGCLFHLSQAISKKIRSLGCKIPYQED